jgi:cell division protein FtsN
MERDRKVMGLLAGALIVIFAFSYAVGYYIGKQAGIKEEKERCEVEKKQLMKTLARITPVSRPQPQIEEKVVGAPTLAELQKEEETKEEEKPAVELPTQVATAEVKGEEEKPAEEKAEEVSKREEKAAPTKAPQKEPSESKQETSKPKKLYFLQVGVFKSSANAQKLVNALKAKGFDAKILRSGNLVKVIVGDFNSWSSANAVKKELKKAGYDSIIRWRKS